MASPSPVSPISTPDLSSHVKADSGGHFPETNSRKSSTDNQGPLSIPQMDPSPTTDHHSLGHVGDSASSKSRQTQHASTPTEDTRDVSDESIPGAFPTNADLRRMKEEEAQVGPPPSTSKAVKDTAEALRDYAKGFIPPSLGRYFSRKKGNTPTTEEPSGSNVGVGSLPGNNQESSVALLPDERPPKDNMPSSEQISGSNVGVGSLPGGAQESGVAKLPEERSRSNTPKVTETSEDSSDLPPTSSRAEAPSSSTTYPETVVPPDERTGKTGKVTFPDTSPSEPGVHPHGRRRGSWDLPGRKEPHATPYQHPDTGQSAHEQIDVSGEEVEARLQQGVTPKTLQRQELALSDISDIEEELRYPPSPSTARPSGYSNEPSASNARYFDTAMPPFKSYSPVRGTNTLVPPNGTPRNIASGFGTNASPPVRSYSPEPVPARAMPSTAEPPTQVYSNIPGVGGSTVSETQAVEPPTQGRGISVVDSQIGATVQKANEPTARTDSALDVQPGDGAPHEGPEGQTLASTSAAETSPKRNNGRGKIGSKIMEEWQAGEEKTKETGQKTKGSLMRRLAEVFHRKSSKRRNASDESAPGFPDKSDDQARTQGRQQKVPERPRSGARLSCGNEEAGTAVLSENQSRRSPYSISPVRAQKVGMDDQRRAGYQQLGVGMGHVGQNPVIGYLPHIQSLREHAKDHQTLPEDQQSLNPEAQIQDASGPERVRHTHHNQHHEPEPQQPEAAPPRTQTDVAPVGVGLFESIDFRRGRRVAETAGIAGTDLFSLSQAKKNQEERQREIESGERRTVVNERTINAREAETHHIEFVGQEEEREREIEMVQRQRAFDASAAESSRGRQEKTFSHEDGTHPPETPSQEEQRRGVENGRGNLILNAEEIEGQESSSVHEPPLGRTEPYPTSLPQPRSVTTILATKRGPIHAPDDIRTPQNTTIHASRSIPENFSPRVLLSTREQIFGKQADLMQPLRDEYVRSVINESEEAPGMEGTLPTPMGLNALIGERMYDDHMRSVGEPSQTIMTM